MLRVAASALGITPPGLKELEELIAFEKGSPN